MPLRLTLPRRLKGELETAAAANGVTLSDLVRLILRAWLLDREAAA